MHFLKERYSGKFNIYLSTNKEYLSIVQYSRLLDRFPDLKQICLSQGVQKDFTFIRNLKSKYPDVELEILANEGCLLSCPYRMEHNAFTGNGMTTMQGMNYELFRFNYDLCNYDWENRDEEYFMSRQVYPWDLDAYDGLIDTFKLAGRDNGEDMKLEMYRLYFDLYTNPENMHYTPFASIFLSRCSCNDKFGTLMISTIKPYLPKIEYFMNKKDSCNTSCGVTCNYCKECAEKAKQELLI
jgi:collagenase-like PrtC family protease